LGSCRGKERAFSVVRANFGENNGVREAGEGALPASSVTVGVPGEGVCGSSRVFATFCVKKEGTVAMYSTGFDYFY
jgi:hypothetical protein